MNSVYRFVILVLALAVLAMAASAARAAAGCCDRCGCEGCQRVCRLVCDERELEVNCWDSRCEEFCVPGHCKLGCKHSAPACSDGSTGCADGACDAQCDACGSGPCAGGPCAKKFVWRDTIPGCARIFTQKKLLKKVEKKKVKTYKWVLEDLCDKCRAGCESSPVPQGTAVPPVPAAAHQDGVAVLSVPAIPVSDDARGRLTDAHQVTARQQLSDWP